MQSVPLSADIGSFQQHGSAFWDAHGPYRTLHQINPARLQFVERFVVLSGLRVLDVGCGGGILAESMARRGAAAVTGIDLAEKSLKTAEAHARMGGVDNVRYRCVSVEDLAAENPHGYDVVTCMEMMEHVPDPASVIRACAKLAKPDGMVFFSTINRNAKSYLHAILGAEYVLNLVPKGTHDWQKFITPAELARMCRQAGLDIADIKGLGYKPFLKRYFLSGDTSVNYMAACRPAEAV